jgi:hypothetical protein
VYGVVWLSLLLPSTGLPHPSLASFAGTPLSPSSPSPSHPPLPHHDDSFEMTPILATASASAPELLSLPHIEIIDPPNKLRQEIKTKNHPGTCYGNEFGATLTSCGDNPDDPAESPSLAVPGSDSDGKGSPTPLICLGQFAADPHAGRGLPLDPTFSQMFQRAADVLIFPYAPPPPPPSLSLSC